MNQRETTFHDDLSPRGFRRLTAIGVIFLTSALPAVSAWQNEPAPEVANRRGFVPFGGMPPPPGLQRFEEPKRAGIPAGRSALAMIGSAFGLALYYPRRGFKRYALLCGPLLGLGMVIATSWWISGRAEAYRFELVFAAIFGGLPGAALYALLARRKWRKRQEAESIWI